MTDTICPWFGKPSACSPRRGNKFSRGYLPWGWHDTWTGSVPEQRETVKHMCGTLAFQELLPTNQEITAEYFICDTYAVVWGYVEQCSIKSNEFEGKMRTESTTSVSFKHRYTVHPLFQGSLGQWRDDVGHVPSRRNCATLWWQLKYCVSVK